MLKQHEPHPALVLDRHWNVVRTNEAAPRFFGSFIELDKRPKPQNLLDLMIDPVGMRPFVEEWEKVAAGLLQKASCRHHVRDSRFVPAAIEHAKECSDAMLFKHGMRS
jgi:hypothetical protein